MRNHDYTDAAKRLAAYEDTGLTPQEITDGRLLTGWIPVHERLPEEFAEVLISDGDWVGYGYYHGNPDSSGWGDTIADCDTTVSAWMPLPEPYKPEN